MNKINYILFAVLSLFMLSACGDDSADDPKFGDSDVPRIYIDWVKELVYETGDTIRLDPKVSPSDGATYKWTLGDKVISEERTVDYKILEHGEFQLKLEVSRNGVENSRIASVIVGKPFVAKQYTNKSVAFFNTGGSLTDIDWNNITHLVLSSAKIKDGLPDFKFGESTLNIAALVTAAHNNGVYVLLEVAGEYTAVNAVTPWGDFTFYNAVTTANGRKNVSKALLDYASKNKFDGINVFMDKASVNGVYDDPATLKLFFEELATTAPEETEWGKFHLTMSVVSGWTRGSLNDMVNMPRYDWINVLAFANEDLTPAPHASFWAFTDNIDYWILQDVAKDRIVPVAPAFGINYKGKQADMTAGGWGGLHAFTSYLSYKSILNDQGGAASANSVVKKDTGTGPDREFDIIYYDGLNEVKAKAEYVVAQKYGGMGLWSLENDIKESSKSLMKQINTSLGN